jgi:FMN-dependent NADH-azoreductase
MPSILHLDSSARAGRSDRDAHGSHTRRLSASFVERWHASRPHDPIVRRDLGLDPPALISGDWIHAAFTPPERREPWMHEALAHSDTLVDELLAADLIVAGIPMYNFNVPAAFKAYIDQIVRVGRTFGFDRSRNGEPYWPLLAGLGKKLVVLSSRGDYGYADRLHASNHVEPSVRTAFAYMGIIDVASVAIEYDEFGGDRLQYSIERAEAASDALVDAMLAEQLGLPNAPMPRVSAARSHG